MGRVWRTQYHATHRDGKILPLLNDGAPGDNLGTSQAGPRSDDPTNTLTPGFFCAFQKLRFHHCNGMAENLHRLV
jgi:hypothetical protein